MYTARTLETHFIKSTAHFSVLMVTGARQVGKTTFLRHLCDDRRRYVTLDDPLILRLAREDAPLFMQRFPPPLLIDEIQYAPELLPHIKMAADRSRAPNLFWLTGSQPFHLMQGVSESLAGRVCVFHLLGLSQKERQGDAPGDSPFLPTIDSIAARVKQTPSSSVNAVYRTIWRGSFPAVALNDEADPSLFYRSYIQTYLQRDLRDLARVGDEMSFLRFLRAAAARSGQLLNVAELSRDADIAPNTAKSWLSILQTSGVVFLLEPYHSNVTKRLVKRPKLYCLDTGLCAFLTGWTTPETLESGAAAGGILETWVIGEILKSWWHCGQHAPFYFFRDKDKKEIDLIIEENGTLYPVEIKKTASPNRNAFGQFQSLAVLGKKIGPGAVICFVEQSIPLTESITALPVGAL